MSAPTPLPWALRLVALLFLFQGICAVITIGVCALHNRIQLDFDVLGLFIYFGLHRLSRGWRSCALFFSFLEMLLAPVVAFISFFARDANVSLVGFTGPAIPPFFVTLTSILCFVIALMQWSVLKRPDVAALFEQRRMAEL